MFDPAHLNTAVDSNHITRMECSDLDHKLIENHKKYLSAWHDNLVMNYDDNPKVNRGQKSDVSLWGGANVLVTPKIVKT